MRIGGFDDIEEARHAIPRFQRAVRHFGFGRQSGRTPAALAVRWHQTRRRGTPPHPISLGDRN